MAIEALGSTSATGAVSFSFGTSPPAPPRAVAARPTMALGRVTARTPVQTKGIALKPPPVALGRVTSRTVPATMGLAGARRPSFSRPLASPASSGAGCTEPPTDRILADGRPHRDPAAVSAYLACVDRQRTREAALATPGVSSTPIAYEPPSGPAITEPTYYEPASSPPIVAGSPQMVAPDWTSPSSSAVAAAAGTPAGAQGIADAVSPQFAPVYVVAGAVALGVLGFILHRKGIV